MRPLFFEYVFYKPADHSWNLLLENKIDFYSFYYYFPTDPPEHRAELIRLTLGLIQDGDKSVPRQNYFNFFYSKLVFKPIYVFLDEEGVIISLNLQDFSDWRPIYCRNNWDNLEVNWPVTIFD